MHPLGKYLPLDLHLKTYNRIKWRQKHKTIDKLIIRLEKVSSITVCTFWENIPTKSKVYWHAFENIINHSKQIEMKWQNTDNQDTQIVQYLEVEEQKK